MLYWIMWEAVRRLEEISLKVSFHANHVASVVVCFVFQRLRI